MEKVATKFAIEELGVKWAATVNDGDAFTQRLSLSCEETFAQLEGEVVLSGAVNKGDRNMKPTLNSLVGFTWPQTEGLRTVDNAYEGEYGYSPEPPDYSFAYDTANMVLEALSSVAVRSPNCTLPIGCQELRNCDAKFVTVDCFDPTIL
ncbi:hypothetical protein [Roseofilum sp. Belize Diploria]|uniref:hypothetical protein n=1 Tax=Roseofilum sp. Belize Diploria TaxID=2821501 RepID=UPI001B171F9F|nr:hypothetical protein [Roseofilum sp. Belize Diploria]MBP0009655.1 hypothetical protein [Roseofilum sp. Belize Diploria]